MSNGVGQSAPSNAAKEKWTMDNDVRIKTISIDGTELKLVMESLSIYEDVLSSTMSASLTFNDANNLPKNLPIIGQQEKLVIKFKIPGAKEEEFKFDIYKVESRLLSAESKTQLVTVKAVTPERFKDIHTLVSKSYYKPIHEIIQDIFDDNVKAGDKELKIWNGCKTDSEKRKFIIPNWHPIYAINWLKARGQPQENLNACHYLFYEDRENFNLVTIEKLAKPDDPMPYFEYYYMPTRYRHGGVTRDAGHQHRNVQRLTFEDAGNRLDENIDGMYGSKILTHDIVKKEYEVTEWQMKDKWDDTKHVAKEDSNYPINKEKDAFSGQTDTFKAFYPIHHKLNMENDLWGGDTVEENEKYKDWMLKRKSLMRQIGSMVVNIRVSGDSRRKCGDLVILNVTPLEANSKEDKKIDKYISGRYLTTSIRHNITQDGYWMDMELCKDNVQEAYKSKSEGGAGGEATQA